MGEKERFFPIPSYLQVGEERIKILKLGKKGVIVERSDLLLNLAKEGNLKGSLVFPYDGYNEIVIKNITLQCEDKGDKVLHCSFVNLTEDQEDFLGFLIGSYLLKRVISIPSDFMNYTQDKEVREELLSLYKRANIDRKLKKVSLLGIGLFTSFLISFIVGIKEIFFKENSPVIIVYHDDSLKETKLKESNKKLRKKEENISNFNISEPNNSSNQSDKFLPKIEFFQEHTSLQRKLKDKEEQDKANPVLKENKSYYCIQVASDKKPTKLIEFTRNFYSFPNVRVEKINNIYTLRIGFWEDRKKAKESLEEVKRRVKDAFLRRCAYKPNRWVYPELHK